MQYAKSKFVLSLTTFFIHIRMYTEQGSCSRTTICQRQGSRFGSSCQAGFPKHFTLFNHRNIDWLLFFSYKYALPQWRNSTRSPHPFPLHRSLAAAPGPLRLQRPRIITAPQNSSVSLHHTAILECMATGYPRPIISWSRADSKSIDVYNTQVLGNGNLIIMDIQRKHGGVYMCRATTPGTRNYTVASANVTVLGKEVLQFGCQCNDTGKKLKLLKTWMFLGFFLQAPPSMVESPESLTRPRAGTARFVCQAEGVPTPQISWLKNGEKIKSNGRIKMYNRYLASF